MGLGNYKGLQYITKCVICIYLDLSYIGRI